MTSKGASNCSQKHWIFVHPQRPSSGARTFQSADGFRMSSPSRAEPILIHIDHAIRTMWCWCCEQRQFVSSTRYEPLTFSTLQYDRANQVRSIHSPTECLYALAISPSVVPGAHDTREERIFLDASPASAIRSDASCRSPAQSKGHLLEHARLSTQGL